MDKENMALYGLGVITIVIVLAAGASAYSLYGATKDLKPIVEKHFTIDYGVEPEKCMFQGHEIFYVQKYYRYDCKGTVILNDTFTRVEKTYHVAEDGKVLTEVDGEHYITFTNEPKERKE